MQPVKMTIGDTQSLIISLTDSATRRPTDFLPGDLVVFGAKKTFKDTTYAIYKEVVEFEGSKAYIVLEAADTELLSPGDYLFDVELRRGTQVHTLVPVSKLTLLPQVVTGG